jgi:hypothetical protein
MSDPALVSALTLLFSNYERHEVFAAVHDAMTLPEKDRHRLVCVTCGSEDLSFPAHVTWDDKLNWFHNIDVETGELAFCNICENQTHDKEVPFDYVHPNKE